MSNPLRNVSLKDCRKFLDLTGCKHIRSSGGHDVWTRSDFLRPIVLQSHIDPVPERIMKQILTALEMDRDEFVEKMSEL